MYTAGVDCQRLTRDLPTGKTLAMKFLIANWKMNGSAERVREFAFSMNQALGRLPCAVTCVFCPPASYLSEAKLMLPQNAQLKLGAQTCHSKASGAYTGELSAAMVRDIGADYVILGHSERRAAGESDTEILGQAVTALAAGLTPVICVGESREAYEAGKTAEILKAQLQPFATLASSKLLIAYEPIWAIGTGLTPKTAEISAAHAQIKMVLGSATPVLYGGSVNPTNLGEILKLSEVAGALIGGASLEIESMMAMTEIAAK